MAVICQLRNGQPVYATASMPMVRWLLRLHCLYVTFTLGALLFVSATSLRRTWFFYSKQSFAGMAPLQPLGLSDFMGWGGKETRFFSALSRWHTRHWRIQTSSRYTLATSGRPPSQSFGEQRKVSIAHLLVSIHAHDTRRLTFTAEMFALCVHCFAWLRTDTHTHTQKSKGPQQQQRDGSCHARLRRFFFLNCEMSISWIANVSLKSCLALIFLLWPVTFWHSVGLTPVRFCSFICFITCSFFTAGLADMQCFP